MRFAYSGLIILLAMPVGWAAARQRQPPQQQQDDSPAEAARRAREQKKDQAKPAKVWDNDNVPASSHGISVVGQSEQASAEASNPSAHANAAVSAPASSAEKREVKSDKEIAAAKEELAALKSRLQVLKTDLDLLQRKFALDTQTYMSNPNPDSDKAGAGGLADEKSQIDAKQQEVEAEQKKVDELEAKLKDSAPAGDAPSSNPN